MKKIELGKKYTCDGEAGTVRYIDGKRKGLPVLWEDFCGNIYSFDAYGRNAQGVVGLVEVCPYAGIPIDASGWARDGFVGASVGAWRPCHFAGVDSLGRPMVWPDGRTHHTARSAESWHEFTTTKPEGVE